MPNLLLLRSTLLPPPHCSCQATQDEIAFENQKKKIWLFGYHIAVFELKENIFKTSHLPSQKEAAPLPHSLNLCLAFPIFFAWNLI